MPAKEWMLGLPGHNEVVSLDDVLLLVRGGQLRPTDLVKKIGEPWRAANEFPELASHFTGKPTAVAPPRPAPERRPTERVPKVDPPKAAAPPRPTSRPSPTERRSTTGRVARPSETRPPAAETRPGSDTRPPASDSRPIEKTPVSDETPAAPAPRKPEETKAAPPDRTPVPATRPIPKPPPRPRVRLEPMIEKYFSPVDLLRCASFAFEPRRLLLTACLVAPLAILVTVLSMAYGEGVGVGQKIAGVLSLAAAVFGLSFVLTALALVTRRQVEGQAWRAGDALEFATANLTTALLYPVVVLIPSLVSASVLWVLGLIRNSGAGGASFLKIVYLLPMVFSLVAVLGVFIYQLASMYVPTAAAVEGHGLTASVNTAWNHVRRQWGRMVLHWLIVTVAVGVITAVFAGLALLAVYLPELVFARPSLPDDVQSAWANFGALFSLYVGLALGLGLAVPVSLFSTLGGLSYMSLRLTAAAQLAVAPPDETSGAMWPSSTPRASTHPAEATQPAETRPAPPDATNPGGGAESKTS